MKRLIGAAAAVLLWACATADAGVEGEAFGEPLTLTAVTPVATILKDPEAWVGRKVLVEGMVVEVCEKRGCWMDIAADGDFQSIQIKVEDGEIVFPLTARGRRARVEGTVEKLELTMEQALEEARRHAEEHGEAFDPASVTGPETTYRIRGIGAVLTD